MRLLDFVYVIHYVKWLIFVFAKVSKGRAKAGFRAILKDFEIKKLPLLYKTNRFHVAALLFSNRSQKTSKCGNNISDILVCGLVYHFFCSYHILTSSVIYY